MMTRRSSSYPLPRVQTSHIWTLAMLALFPLGGCQGCGEGDPPPETPPWNIDCMPGTLGCACDTDNTCGEGEGGEALVCDDDVCASEGCPTGEPGCVCDSQGGCDNPEDACVDGFCEVGGCDPGELGCACDDDGECQSGLVCDEDATCVEEVGNQGNACKDDGTCEDGFACDRMASPPVCVACEAGQRGCQCDAGACGAGLECLENHCVGDETIFGREIPEDPQCYTPCLADLDETRTCEDGLLAGCVDGRVCEQGSCVIQGEPRTVCFEDNDCPSFQLCIQGHCYSDCQEDDDCSEGKACIHKVCRTSCSVADDTCADGEICETTGDIAGGCVSAPTASEVVFPTPSEGEISLDVNAIAYSPVKISQEVILENNTDRAVTFTLRKRSHEALLSDGSRDLISDNLDEACNGASCPLWWVEMGEFGDVSASEETTVTADANCKEDCPRVIIRLANNGQALDATRWRGAIEVSADGFFDRIDLSYARGPEGRWAGHLVTFSNFETQGIDTDADFTGWLDRPSRDDVTGVRNGLLKRWGAFRVNNIIGGWDEMKAILAATEHEQWRQPDIQEICPALQGVCYLYDEGEGIFPRIYVTELNEAPIPTGASKTPIAIDLSRQDGSGENHWAGRIDSAVATQFPGNPHVELGFESATPGDSGSCDPSITSNCVVFMDEFSASQKLGGRYVPPPNAMGCVEGFELRVEPLLVPTFVRGVERDPMTNNFSRRICVDTRLPHLLGDPPDAALEANNLNIARANPTFNGQIFEHDIEFLDGALIDGEEMLILVRQKIPSLVHVNQDRTSYTYGYLYLTRQPTRVFLEDEDGDGTPDAFVGNKPPQDLTEINYTRGARCAPPLLEEILGPNPLLNTGTAPVLIENLVRGGSPAPDAHLSHGGTEQVHYLCEDTGLFDGGPGNTAAWGDGNIGPNDDSCLFARNGICEDGEANSTASKCAAGTDITDCGGRHTDTRVDCPRTSRVIFFTLDAPVAPNLADEPCQQSGTCNARLTQWQTNNTPFLLQVDPPWLCEDESATYCDPNTLDRRAGKIFFPAQTEGVHYLPLRAEIDEAFRYKRRFEDRAESDTSFVPALCEEGAGQTPYCYDPRRINAISDRVDCLLELYDRYYADGDNGDAVVADRIRSYLKENFATRAEGGNGGDPALIEQGFETLRAELLIMLGDDMMTQALTAKHREQRAPAAPFEGFRLEPGGIQLSGAAGYEMFRLHQAMQLYDMVIERLHTLAPATGKAIDTRKVSTDRSFITREVAFNYLDRIARASTQRALVMSEIVNRYHRFGEPELARSVLERAHTRTSLESAALIALIREVNELTAYSDAARSKELLDRTQRGYYEALIALDGAREELDRGLDTHHLNSAVVPLPSLTDAAPDTWLSQALSDAWAATNAAKLAEQAARQTTPEHDVDAVALEAELMRKLERHDTALRQLCGEISDDEDGTLYPAIVRYAHRDAEAALIGDPCGFAPADKGATTSAIEAAFGELEARTRNMRQTSEQLLHARHLLDQERERAASMCDGELDFTDYHFDMGGASVSASAALAASAAEQERAVRLRALVMRAIALRACDSGNPECRAARASLDATLAATAGLELASEAEVDALRAMHRELSKTSGDARWSGECEGRTIDADVRTRERLAELIALQVTLQREERDVLEAITAIERLWQRATHHQLAMDEDLSLAADLDATLRSPTSRIYQESAFLEADETFDAAHEAVYRLMLLFERTSQQTYADRDLILTARIASTGTNNLEALLQELESAILDFEEAQGQPDARVMQLSLRDDILHIPRLGADGDATSIDRRAVSLRGFLEETARRDASGRIVIPFSLEPPATSIDGITHNDRVMAIDVRISSGGSNASVEDGTAQAKGVSVIHRADDETTYRVFSRDAATLTTGPAMQGNSSAGVPLANSTWELTIAPEVDLGGLSDIELVVYYSNRTR